jgi:aldose 1-epimerase
MSVRHTSWGTDIDGATVHAFTLANASGMTVTVLSWGAAIQSVRVPDRNGHYDDVVLGFDTLAPYLGYHPNFGVTAGRFANRIAHAQFALDGVRYALHANNGPHALHGGKRGFSHRNWHGELAGPASVRFLYTSPDGEEGYPGTLQAAVTYELDDANGLLIEFTATTDRATVVNLTNHSYWNLAGGGTILGHEMAIFADAFLPVDATAIPSGEVRPVAGTPLDFRTPTRIGERIPGTDVQLRNVKDGIDHTFVLGAPGPQKSAARVYDPGSGRVMDVHATQPGVQCYTGNQLDGSIRGKGHAVYAKYAGLCLETHHFPDSPNQPGFPTTVLRPGAQYHHTAVYRFSTR